MGIVIRFQGGQQAGRTEQFGDEVERIVLGRDVERCQVVFPAEATAVGREHCALQRVLGRFRLVLPHGHLVLIDGRPAHDGQELPVSADVQLGKDGPRLIFETTATSPLPPTAPQPDGAEGTWTVAKSAARRSRRVGYLAEAALVFSFAVIVIGVWVAWHTDPLVAALHKAKASVYLVLVRSSSGHKRPIATAWVADHSRGFLATNCHVAKVFNDLEEGEQLLVASGGASPRELRVDSVQLHPGYEAFDKVWNKFDPVRQTGRQSWERIHSAGKACDVALLHVTDREGLAESLPLAPGEVLQTLDAGSPIGFVGFPMEGVAIGGVNVKRPAATTQVGRVTAVTDYLDVVQADWKENLLIQNSLPGSGGDSGSPVLNAKGQVVALVSAGNSIGETAAGLRLWSGAQISYAQRVDLLRELLDGTAGERQARRTERWTHEVAQYYRRYTDVSRENWSSVAVDNWLATVRELDDGDYTFKAVETSRSHGHLEKSGEPDAEFRWQHDFDLSDAGDYLLVAIAESDATISFNATISEADGSERLLESDESSKLPDWFAAVNVSAGRGASLAATMTSADDPPPAGTLILYKAEKTLIPADVRIEAAVREWNSIQADATPALLEQAAGTLQQLENGDITAVRRIQLVQPGAYLILAIAPGGEDLDIGVSRTSDEEAELLARDRRPSCLAVAHFSLAAETEVEVLVVGARAEIAWQLRVYRAAP